MLLRFILWTIILFIAGKIIGGIIRSVRLFLTPNKHISPVETRGNKKDYSDVQDIPYEEIPKS